MGSSMITIANTRYECDDDSSYSISCCARDASRSQCDNALVKKNIITT